MLEKITDLKEKTSNPQVKSLCEEAIANLSTIIYNNVSPDAKVEIERVTMDNLFNELSKIEEKDVQSWVANGKRIYSLKNLGIRETINKLGKEEGKENPSLMEFLDSFKPKLEEDPEVLLYEEFLSGLQAFSYYPVIGSAVDAIADRVNSYKNDIDLSKILETMKKTRSSYLIPFIEPYVNNYLNEKNEQNKSFLKEALIKFSYDPFIRDIISIVTIDSTQLQLEYANAKCDIEKVYSPIIYLGENEAVFNIKGNYYIKKGNHINRLPEEDFPKLDKEFVEVCETINSPEVEILGNSIHLYIGKDHAEITESGVKVNDKEFDEENTKNLVEAANWAGNREFLNKVFLIKKNFNEIAEVDFVKRVFLKENENRAADIFKLRDNVFISTYNPEEGKITFFRNINPIQAKNIMMEHLNFNVSSLFKDLLPQEEKIKEEINQTKKSYVDYIDLLEGKIKSFSRQNLNEVTKEVLEALRGELEEVKDEYRDYLNMIERYTIGPEDIEIKDVTEGIVVTVDVDGQKYQIPIPEKPAPEAIDVEGGEEAGTEVGDKELEDQPASAVTFDDNETELLGDTPSIPDDEVDLGSDETEEEAEDAEKEAEEEEEDTEELNFDDAEGEADKEAEDEDEEDEDQADEVEKKEKKKKKTLEKESFVEESSDKVKKPKQKKVFLKKKKKI